jgi:hypothetical protein
MKSACIRDFPATIVCCGQTRMPLAVQMLMLEEIEEVRNHYRNQNPDLMNLVNFWNQECCPSQCFDHFLLD